MSATTRAVSRRGFLGGALALVGAWPLATGAAAATAVAARAATGGVAGSGYRSLTSSEAPLVEAMVNALCPADALTPDGVSSGLAAFVDASLAGMVESDAPGHPGLFRAGLSAADEACRARLGVPFHELSATDGRQFLRDIAAGNVDADFPLQSWASDVVDPLLKRACFSGQVYDRFGSRMFVKLFG